MKFLLSFSSLASFKDIFPLSILYGAMFFVVSHVQWRDIVQYDAGKTPLPPPPTLSSDDRLARLAGVPIRTEPPPEKQTSAIPSLPPVFSHPVGPTLGPGVQDTINSGSPPALDNTPTPTTMVEEGGGGVSSDPSQQSLSESGGGSVMQQEDPVEEVDRAGET